MTQIFISHTQENTDCANHIRQDLEAQSYNIWQNRQAIEPGSARYARTIENAILGSAALVLVWSAGAAKSQEVDRQIFFAQRLKKFLLPVVLDGTKLPDTLVYSSPITSRFPCADAAAKLVQHLPAPDGKDPLLMLYEQAADEGIVERKKAIQKATEMLHRGEHREELLALLEYLAQNDLMSGVQEMAQAALDGETKKGPLPSKASQPDPIFDATCRQGHVSYFDKRVECPSSRSGWRGEGAGGDARDVLYLKCNQCGEEMIVYVNCEGYR